MGQKEKLIARLRSRPRDLTFGEVETLLGFFSYKLDNKGRSSGSRVMFVSDVHPPILLHRPHPGSVLKTYQVRQLADLFEKEGLI